MTIGYKGPRGTRRVRFGKLKAGDEFKWGSIDPHYRKVDEDTAVRLGGKYIGRLYGFGDTVLVTRHPEKAKTAKNEPSGSRIRAVGYPPTPTPRTKPGKAGKSQKKASPIPARPLDLGTLISIGYEQSDCNDEGMVDFGDALRIAVDEGYAPPTDAERAEFHKLWKLEFPRSRSR